MTEGGEGGGGAAAAGVAVGGGAAVLEMAPPPDVAIGVAQPGATNRETTPAALTSAISDTDTDTDEPMQAIMDQMNARMADGEGMEGADEQSTDGQPAAEDAEQPDDSTEAAEAQTQPDGSAEVATEMEDPATAEAAEETAEAELRAARTEVAGMAIDDRRGRLGIQAIAGRLNVYLLAQDITAGKLSKSLAEKPLAERSRLRRAWAVVTLAPDALLWTGPRRYAKGKAMREIHTSAARENANAEYHGDLAMEAMKKGTPEMQAMAVEIEIVEAEQERAQLGENPNEEERVKADARIAELSKRRLGIKKDDKPVPNQLEIMAQQFAAVIEPDGALPKDENDEPVNPAKYVRQRMAEALIDPKSRDTLLDGLVGAGVITEESKTELTKKAGLVEHAPVAYHILKLLATGGGLSIALALFSLWFRMKKDRAAGAGGGGGHR